MVFDWDVLEEDESPVQLVRVDADGPFVFVCEHASNRIPTVYTGLGVSDSIRTSHSGWDIGALELSLELSQRFNSPLVASTVSRLVYDCNRSPDSTTAIVLRSENDDVPGNIGLSDESKNQRVNAVYQPFSNNLSALLDKRTTRNLGTYLVTIHSFTPVLRGQERKVQIGILHDSDKRLADDLLLASEQCSPYHIERNQPYGPDDDVTHTLKKHAIPRQLHNVMLEVRNDLLSDSDGVLEISDLLFSILNKAIRSVKSRTSVPENVNSGGTALNNQEPL